MSSVNFQLKANPQVVRPDGSGAAPSRARSSARILRSTAISPELSVSHVRARAREWLVVHAAACAPQVLPDRPPDGSNALSIPIILYAATSEERDRLLQLLPAHLAATTRDRPDPVSHVFEVQELRIDRDTHRVTVAGEEIPLPLLQFRLLLALIERRERVQSRGALLRDVWGIRETTPTRTVDTHVKRLRDRLRGAGRFIQSIRGVGYRFSEIPCLSVAEWGRSRPGEGQLLRKGA